jgi:hypothetical protein
MTNSVEADNAEVRHSLARVARTSRCASRSIEALRRAVKLFVHAWNRPHLHKRAFPATPATSWFRVPMGLATPLCLGLVCSKMCHTGSVIMRDGQDTGLRPGPSHKAQLTWADRVAPECVSFRIGSQANRRKRDG